MKVVLVMFKDGERRDFPLSAAANVIGRKSDCALRIPTADVSRQHCEINVLNEDITVRDLGSANGTYVNGTRIAETTLKPGDEVAVGPVKFILQVDGQPAEIEPPPHSDDSGAGDVIALGEDDLFLLEDDNLDEDDAFSALENMTNDDDGDEKAS